VLCGRPFDSLVFRGASGQRLSGEERAYIGRLMAEGRLRVVTFRGKSPLEVVRDVRCRSFILLTA
jgi:hypothetical protein